MTDDDNRIVTYAAMGQADDMGGIVARAWLDAVTPRPLDDWCEGCVLWWRLPVEEPPYCGEPGDSGWIEDYYTHWTPLVCPMVASDKIKKASIR